MEEQPRCGIWKELCKIDYNFYDSKDGKTKKIDQDNIGRILLSQVNENDKVVINGGHYIPFKTPSKNAISTWKFACDIAKFLSQNNVNVSVSLMVNDVKLREDEKKKNLLKLPEIYATYINKNNIQITYYSNSKQEVYSEKKCANRFESKKFKKKWDLYCHTKVNNYCISSTITYLRDIIKQGATISIWISPKCSWHNLIESIELFNQHEHKFRNFVYFYTDNCFE